MSTSPQSISIHAVVVNTRIVTFWSETDSKGLTIPYTNISLHAAQAPESRGQGSRGCIYMQLDGASHLISESTTNGNNHESPDLEEEGDDEDTRGLVEIHLIPSDGSTCKSPAPLSYRLMVVSTFYEGLCACASLHPDIHPAEEDMMFDNATWITSDSLEPGAFDDAEDDSTTDGNVSKWRRTE